MDIFRYHDSEIMDLNLLSNAYRRRDDPRDKPVPLWTIRSSDPDAEYFEFIVLAEDNERLENGPCQHCPMCEVDVPMAYWKEHNESVKHKACSNIAAIGLDRSRKQVLLEESTDSRAQNKDDSLYYCPSCSCAVTTSARQAHEQSPEHTKSVLYDKLITSLLLLYQDKSNFTSVFEDITGKNFKNDAKNEDIIGKNFKNDAKNVFDREQSLNDIESKSRNEQTNLHDTELKTDNQTPKETDTLLPTKIQKGIDKNDSSHHYCIFQTKDKKYICAYCDLILKNDSEKIKEHIATSSHLNNRKELLRKNYMETMNNIIFCAFCHLTVQQNDELKHIMGRRHQKEYLLFRNEIVKFAS